jgi:tetratricopeptide (TPR) repeat protein
LLFLVPTTSAVGDIEPRVPSDFDAEFARAAESLEAGRRPEAEQALEAIRERSTERAWEARIAFLLAADDLRRKDFAASVRRLRLAPAASIGLEPYRLMLLGRALDAAGQSEAAAREYRAAFETEEPFAARATAGRALAAALEKRGDRKGAGEALARVAAGASRSGAAAVPRSGSESDWPSMTRPPFTPLPAISLFAGVAPETAPALERGPLKQELAR